jgi:hypothetical protein
VYKFIRIAEWKFGSGRRFMIVLGSKWSH